jgi:hypothetical protein
VALTLMYSLTDGVPLTPATNDSLLSSVIDGTETCSGAMSRTAASAVDTNVLMYSDTCSSSAGMTGAFDKLMRYGAKGGPYGLLLLFKLSGRLGQHHHKQSQAGYAQS